MLSRDYLTFWHSEKHFVIALFDTEGECYELANTTSKLYGYKKTFVTSQHATLAICCEFVTTGVLFSLYIMTCFMSAPNIIKLIIILCIIICSKIHSMIYTFLFWFFYWSAQLANVFTKLILQVVLISRPSVTLGQYY